MEEMELWVDIKGYEGLYQISSFGRVRSLDRGMYVRQDRYREPRWVARKGKVLKNYNDGSDRRMVILYDHAVSKNHAVHRLVAEHFLPNPNNHRVVNHLNSNHHDNRVVNLEWCTYSENTLHAIRAGRRKKYYPRKNTRP